MFSIELIKAKAIALTNAVKEVNSIIVEFNETNSPKLTELAVCSQNTHAFESIVNGGIVEKVAALGMVYYPYSKAPIQNAFCSSVFGIAKMKRMGFKCYIITHGTIVTASFF